MIVELSPGARVPIAALMMPPDSTAEPNVAFTETKLTPAGSVSTSEVTNAVSGPALATTIVQVSTESGPTGSGTSPLVTEMSALWT